MTDVPVDAAMASASSIARSRALSTSSDRPSAASIYNLMSPPLSVSPQPAFIAASAASQIVTNNHDAHLDAWYEQVGLDPSGEISLISNGALRLANQFIDHLLFNILASAKSTTLSILRTAVVDVLKPKLARDVINAADEELKEYLGRSGVENLARAPPSETSREWDLDLVFKRTRLRCMVYSSLGDMEDEDEDYYMELGLLNNENGGARAELVSPPVAIFLTSILEFMGEQILILAGQAAFSRLQARYEREFEDGTPLTGAVSDPIIVEELDMERVALDRTMGRLWRAWKKKLRSPTEPNGSRPFSRSSANSLVAPAQKGENTATELPTVVPELPVDTTSTQTSRSHGAQVAIQELCTREGEAIDPAARSLSHKDVVAISSGEANKHEELTSRPRSWTVEHSSAHEGSFKHTTSLPCRKKPQSDSMHKECRASVSEDASGAKDTENAELIISPKVETETKAPVRMVEDTDLIEKVTPGTVTVEEIATPASTSVDTDDNDRSDNKETTLGDGKDDETDGEIDEFTEEPEILTTSRVSIAEKSSPTTSEFGRRASIVLTRSNSVGSVRVIEVPGPRSRASSVESNPRSPIRPFSASREASLSRTPPIVEEIDPLAMPHNTVTKPAKIAAGIASLSAEGRDDESKLAKARNRSPPKLLSQQVASLASVPTKLTVVSNHLGSSQEDRHDGYQRPTSSLKSPTLPTLPERSPTRPIYIQSPSAQRFGLGPDSPKLPRPIQGDSTSPARFKSRRPSEDSSATPADLARNFEELIQSNETLQYTLTPESMRDIDSQSHRTGRSDDTRTGDNSRASSIKKSMDSIGRSTWLGSHSTEMVNSKYAGSAKGLQSVQSKSRAGPPPQARDARIARESIQDFADFIRSTGPPGAPAENNSPANRPPTTGSSNLVRTNTDTSLSTTSSMEARRGPKLQARDAVVNSSKESSELIDFIRRGPPSTNGNPRIPRTVAPFRNTQDSDYMTSAMGGKAVDAIIDVRNSLASTNITEASAPSSMNSQSALLNRPTWQQPHPATNGFDEDEIAPKRTQRRVRDPYAIEYSDDEDENYDTMPKVPSKQEESLIDFLNNYPPPPEPVTEEITLQKKKSSTPNLISRLKPGQTANLPGHSRKGSNVSEHRVLSGRVGPRAGHTPIVIPPAVDKNNVALTSVDSPRNASFKRMPMKMFEPRDSSSSNPKTTELADILRGSQTQPQVTSIPSDDKSGSGFSRIFERRKKSTVY